MTADRLPAETTKSLQPRDLTISLKLNDVTFDAIEGLANPVIREALEREALAGWQAEGPTDIFGLWDMGRVDCREHATFWSNKQTYTVVSVMVRLRRTSTATRSW